MSFVNSLSKSHRSVYEYIKRECEMHNGRMQKSMKEISNDLDISEATVHRAIRSLKQLGVIGIIPSTSKTESNEIVFFGEPDEEKQVDDIFQMVSDLGASVNRFRQILNERDNKIQQLTEEIESYKQLTAKQKEIITAFSKIFGDALEGDVIKNLKLESVKETDDKYIIVFSK